MKKNNFLIAALSIVAALSFSACNSNIDDSIVQSEETSQVSNNVNPEIYKIYQLYTAQGGDLSYEDWLESIKGEKGDQGEPRKDGLNGQDGHSSVVSIGDDGYWYRNGMKTEHKAVRDADIQNLQNQINELKAKLS